MQEQKLGGFSPLLVRLYHGLSSAQAALGRKDDAVDSTLTALSIGEQINVATRHLLGSLVYHMDQSCLVRQASDDLGELGQIEAAVVLAKASVNELQDARAKLVGLPEELQGCFKNLLGDQYRAIADLFIRQGRFLEAEWTLGQLKDFESYVYNRNDSSSSGTSFEHHPLTPSEGAFLARILGLPLLEQVRLSQRMSELAANPRPNDEQQDEKDQIADRIKQANDALNQQLAELRQAIAQLKPPTEAAGLSQDLTADGMMSLASVLNDLQAHTALLFSVVLPDRVQILITTKEGTEHVELPVTEEKLNEMIEASRQAYQDPKRDPLPPARALYDLLWRSADEALRKLDVTDVVRSLDAKLRYVPFAALYDGQNYLVERYRLTELTANRREQLLAPSALGPLSAQALGASQGSALFEPLPNVVAEVDGIVKDSSKDTLGLLPGGRWLDKDFSRSGLSTALTRGSPIIHIATHFSLGATDDTSRMLLGDNGDMMSVKDIKDAIHSKTLVFSNVQLLVLSACQTALGNSHELESLAADMQDIGAPWIPSRSATRLREADLNVLSKLSNQGLEWRLEPEAFSGGEVGREDDLLDVLVGCPVDIQVARQPST